MSLDRLLREHYGASSLRPAVKDGLLAVSSESLNGKKTLRYRLAVAAALFIVLAGSLIFLSRNSLESSIRNEVATNHHKMLASEFAMRDLQQLRPAMGELGFSLVESGKVSAHELRLVGARYCSIQGHLAAQLQLEDSAGRHWTLYQAPLKGRLGSVREGVAAVDGIRVELWRENGVLLALASANSSSND